MPKIYESAKEIAFDASGALFSPTVKSVFLLDERDRHLISEMWQTSRDSTMWNCPS